MFELSAPNDDTRIVASSSRAPNSPNKVRVTSSAGSAEAAMADDGSVR